LAQVRVARCRQVPDEIEPTVLGGHIRDVALLAFDALHRRVEVAG
jgi:hypothetical protein